MIGNLQQILSMHIKLWKVIKMQGKLLSNIFDFCVIFILMLFIFIFLVELYIGVLGYLNMNIKEGDDQ